MKTTGGISGINNSKNRATFKDLYFFVKIVSAVELVSKELNHLAPILHVYSGGLIFQKEKGNTSTLLIIFLGTRLQKEQNSTHLLL